MTQPIPFSFQSRQLRIVERDGEPWFVAKDVAAILEYSHTPHMLRILDDDEKGVHIVDRTSGSAGLTDKNTGAMVSITGTPLADTRQPRQRWIFYARVIPVSMAGWRGVNTRPRMGE